MKCSICNYAKTQYIFSKNNYEIFFCKKCKIGFVGNVNSLEVSDYYQYDYFTGNIEKFGYYDYVQERKFREKTFLIKLKKIKEKFPFGGKILDIGCADGTFLDVLDEKWEKYGIEINTEITSEIKNKYNIFNGDFLEYNEEKNFDVITMWDFLDHTKKPLDYVQKAYNLLKPNGYLYVNVGDMHSIFAKLCGRRWYLFIPPTHLYYFTKEGLINMLKKVGFNTFNIQYEGKYVSLRLCFFRMQYIIFHKFFNLIFKKLENNKIGNLSIYFNFFDVITAEARK